MTELCGRNPSWRDSRQDAIRRSQLTLAPNCQRTHENLWFYNRDHVTNNFVVGMFTGDTGMYRRYHVAVALISSALCSCGLTVPQVGEVWDRDYPGDGADTPALTATAQIEYEIKQKVYCELKYAVKQAERVPVFDINGKRVPLVPYGWGAQMQLSLEVDETVALSPGLSFTQLYPNVVKVFGVSNSVTTAQSFTLGLGGTLSSQAFRTDKFNTYYSIKDLVELPSAICTSDGKPDPEKDLFIHDLKWTPATSSPLLIESDLGLKDWLIGAMYFDTLLPSSSQPQQPQQSSANNGKFEGKFKGKLEGTLTGQATGTFEGKTSSGGPSKGGGGGGSGGAGGPQDSVSQELKFIIVSNGNVQPTWKLVQVSANTGNTPFFSTGRTRTHDLIITIGPPTNRTANDFLASQIGQAVRQNPAAQ